ncbi:hypothetical protein BHE74_00002821 [Ensete ventricosum]|nr:hypothetical protein BHE74_00002821 [Ensete ventricosum]RZR75910.1 hypothetical protein BHM03_00000493 [Ensete ventricosum]
MTEAWLVEAGLNPAPRGMSHLLIYFVGFCDLTFPFYAAEMFNLAKMKSANSAASPAIPLPVADVPLAPTMKHPTLGAEKHQRAGGEEPLKKKSKVTVLKWSASTARGST